MEPVKVIELPHGFTIEIHYDDDPINPRTEYDNIGIIASPNRSRLSADKNGMYEVVRAIRSSENYDEEWEAEDSLDGNIGLVVSVIDKCFDIVSLPVYMYSHSGDTINTTGFNCRWDSGQVAIIFTTQRRFEEMTGSDMCFRENAADYLRGEIETYDRYIRGEVYGYITKDPDGDEVDSCWGFYGEDEAEERAKDNSEYYIKEWMNFIPGELF